MFERAAAVAIILLILFYLTWLAISVTYIES
jgi:hypothetical protein